MDPCDTTKAPLPTMPSENANPEFAIRGWMPFKFTGPMT